MKNLIPTLLLIFILFSSLHGVSQNSDRFPLLHKRIMQAKLREIKLKLNLDQSTFDKFSPVYIKYEQEIYEIDFGATAEMMKVNPDSLSVDEADKLILSQLQTGRKLIDIRENYYKQFRAIITPQQIIKLYHSEAELRKKVINELKRRMISK